MDNKIMLILEYLRSQRCNDKEGCCANPCSCSKVVYNDVVNIVNKEDYMKLQDGITQNESDK